MTNNYQDLAKITRPDFPILADKTSNKKSFIYLDHAATSQKPKKVIESLTNYYMHTNANVHRGAHTLSAKATAEFEEARQITTEFIGATSYKEIVFTRNATEAINLVAHSWGDKIVKEGDEILLSVMEHHSNLVPWQLLAQRTGCILRHVGITPTGELDIEEFNTCMNNSEYKEKVLQNEQFAREINIDATPSFLI